jgi:hypothetical protein
VHPENHIRVETEQVAGFAGTDLGQRGGGCAREAWRNGVTRASRPGLSLFRSKGRVFGCVPGHYTWTFDDPYFRLLLLRGMAWAAGESPYRFDSLVLRGVSLRDETGKKPPG